MSTNWELCFFFCQKTKRKDVIRRAPTSFENLIDRRKRFIQLDLIVDLSRIGEGTGIIQTLASNNAFYHKGCYYNLNDNHYERLVKKVQKQSAEGSPYSTQTIPHKQKKTDIGKAVCLFCDNKDYNDKFTTAGEYHSGSNNPNTNHLESLTGN